VRIGLLGRWLCGRIPVCAGNQERHDHRSVRQTEERAALPRCQRMRVGPVCGRRVLRKQLHRTLPELRLARIAWSVFERRQWCHRSAQNLSGSWCDCLLNQRRVRRQRSVSDLCTWHFVQARELHGRKIHLSVHVRLIGSVRDRRDSRLQSIRVQREHLLRHLYQRHPMRVWKPLRIILLWTQACGRELQFGNGLPDRPLCPGRVLRPCMYRRVRCLQRGRKGRKLQQCRGQGAGSAGQVCRNQARDLWNDGKLFGRGLRVRCPGFEL
jgi:hypothetical protein